MHDVAWFEMLKERKRSFNSSSWIPLWADEVVEEVGEFAYEGYLEEYFGSTSILLPVDKKAVALANLSWSDVADVRTTSRISENNVYIESDIFDSYYENLKGIHLVLQQRINAEDRTIWRIHQDLIIALGLLQEKQQQRQSLALWKSTRN